MMQLQFPEDTSRIGSPLLDRERTIDIFVTAQTTSGRVERLIFQVFSRQVTWVETSGPNHKSTMVLERDGRGEWI
jgi:hypothetical protein